MHTRGLALSLVALAAALLLLGVSAGHVHQHGQQAECTLCQAITLLELLDAVSLLEAPQLALCAATPPPGTVDLTLFESASSLSFRGPPA